jgi:hypothetical protein
MKTSLKVALLLIILVGLGFFVRATDWGGVLSSVKKVGFNFLFLMFITFLSSWLGALGWRYCLPKDEAKVSSWQLYWIRMIGENIAILNPTSVIGGEAAKIFMLTDLGVQRRQALHSILLSRAITIISQIMMLLIAGIWFLSLTVDDWSWPVFNSWWILGFPLLVVCLVTVVRSRFFKNILRAAFRRIRLLEPYRKARVFLIELWLELVVFYRENRRAMFLSFLFCSLHWIVGSLEFYFILLFLGVKTTVAKALLVDMGVIVFKTAGGFIPGQIGIEEYGNKVMLAMIGVAGGTIWITASILRRARQLSWILIGFLMYFIRFHRRPVIS